jgi:hypothetical protein
MPDSTTVSGFLTFFIVGDLHYPTQSVWPSSGFKSTSNILEVTPLKSLCEQTSLLFPIS